MPVGTHILPVLCGFVVFVAPSLNRYLHNIFIFRRICNMQEKLFIQWSRFFQTKIANSFYSKINDSSRVRRTGFLSSRSWARVSVVPNILMISLTFVRNSSGSHGTVCKTTGFWNGRYGFESQPLLTFFNLSITTENRASPSYAWKVLWPEFFWNQEGFPYEIFGIVRQNNFDAKSWYSSLNPNIFRYPKLVFFGTVRQKFSAENRDKPILCINFFETPIQWNTEGFPYENFRHCETKKIDGKSWYSLPPPTLLSLKFFDTSNFTKYRRVPLRSFSVLWDNKFSTESRDAPPPPLSYPQQFLIPEFFSYTRVPLRNFSALWGKNFQQKIVIFCIKYRN